MNTTTKVGVLTDKQHMRTDELLSALKDIIRIYSPHNEYINGMEMLEELERRTKTHEVPEKGVKHG